MTALTPAPEPNLTRLLIVDDDADAAWALATVIRLELGCEVETASDGAQAVDQASRMRPQAILMDITMPGVDGIEAAAVLRSLFAPADRPRLIAMTGLDVTGHRKRILDAGFDAFLAKPVALDDVRAALRD